MDQSVSLSIWSLVQIILWLGSVVGAYAIGRWVQRKGVTTENVVEKLKTESTAGDALNQLKPHLAVLLREIQDLKNKVDGLLPK